MPSETVTGDSFLSPSSAPRPLTLLLGGTAALGLLTVPGALATAGDLQVAAAGLGTSVASGSLAAVRYVTRDVRR